MADNKNSVFQSRTWFGIGLVAVLCFAAFLILLVLNFGKEVESEGMIPRESADKPDILSTPDSIWNEPITGLTPLEVHRVSFQSGSRILRFEFLDDDLVHFELSDTDHPIPSGDRIFSSPMVDKIDYQGPSVLLFDGQGIYETPELRVEVNEVTLCISLSDIRREPELSLTEICPRYVAGEMMGISLSQEGFTDVYGLGQQFLEPGVANGTWIDQRRTQPSGNVLEPFDEGYVGNTQFPIAYFLGQDTENYALFVDHQLPQTWDFTEGAWTVSTQGEALRFYLLSGPNLQDLRGDYMELVGRPPVPPKKAFGLWISEYGYDNWEELEAKLGSLRANRFPVDGFALDLQWFGGIETGSDDTREGSLIWDLENFPDPRQKIKSLWQEQGIGLLLIEQPFVGKNLYEHAQMESGGYLVKRCEGCPALYLDQDPWWGKGGMIDWTNQEGATFWHDWKREPLVDLGIVGHWTDLGEPQQFSADAWYAGIPEFERVLHDHWSVHNLYNLLWSRSIFEGYQRNDRSERPFSLSRSGAPGSQRYGVAMWSGDIASRLTSLAAHLNAQMHMSFSGVDYYGADIGGFRKRPDDPFEMYTVWFAHGMALDIPGRPHTFNVYNEYETAPDRVGHLESNLASVRQRYELSPYLYSLAHRAYRFGEPIFPSLVFHNQSDPVARKLADHKLIGKDMLVATVAVLGRNDRGVYLPRGTWVDYRTGDRYESDGSWFGPFPVEQDGLFRLPTFVRSGAILPLMYVDDQTMNILGIRADGSSRDELILRVYADSTPTQFTLYEDDGQTVAYQRGEVRETILEQERDQGRARVMILGSQGDFADSARERDNVVQLYLDQEEFAQEVLLNGETLPRLESQVVFDSGAYGWFQGQPGLIYARSGEYGVEAGKIFEFILAAGLSDSES